MSEKEQISFLPFRFVKITTCPIKKFAIVLIHNHVNNYDKFIYRNRNLFKLFLYILIIYYMKI